MTSKNTPAIRVRSATDHGLIFTKNPHRMVGQDGAYSIPLDRDRSLWYFGDTLIGVRVPGESLWYPGGQPLGPGDMSGHGSIDKLLNNSGLLMGGTVDDFHYITDAHGRMRQLVPHLASEHPDEIRVWCLHGIALREDVYLYYLLVRMLAEGPMPVNFELVGAGLSHGRRGEWNFNRIPHAGSTIWWPSNLPQYGTTVLDGRDGWLYVYGVLRGNDGVQRCHVARVRPAEIADLSRYEYLSSGAPTWGNAPAGGPAVMTGMPNEMSVSWNQHLGCWLAVHSLDLSGLIVGRTAPNPWGPWSEPVTLWKCTPPRLDYAIPYPHLIYAGKEHPELSQDGRELHLTYIEFEEYFPHYVTVLLE